jgi:hypothetical protein
MLSESPKKGAEHIRGLPSSQGTIIFFQKKSIRHHHMARKEFRDLRVDFPLQRGLQRFREIIVYISAKYKDAPLFGATKLNKTLYHSDFRAFERFGFPLTGVAYFALERGPAPKAMVPVLRGLLQEGAIRIEQRQAGNRIQKRVVPLRPAFLEGSERR